MRRIGMPVVPGIIFISLLSTVCLVPAKISAVEGPTNGRVSPLYQTSAPNRSYRLGPNDLLKVQVFGQPDLTLEARVSGDGKIRMPLLGVVEVQGRSVADTEELITTGLSRQFLKNPRVIVYIIKYRDFYVSGQVKNPGGYPYEEGLTVRRALMLAGGLTEKSSKCAMGRVQLLPPHRIETGSVPATLDDPVSPDDMVIVAECPNFYVSGEARIPGTYTYEEGLTVLKAIMLAGGFKNTASERRIKIKRIKEGKLYTVSVKLEDPVFPEDVIMIPESLF